QVGYLFTVAEMKIYARSIKLELIKQSKGEIAIYFSEEGTNEIDGRKVFQVTNRHGRIVGLGMEGSQLKITVQISRLSTDEWLSIVTDIIKELNTAKKEQAPV
ncbi:hypothetical protein, partial [Staphylococcus epidermidis]|uniref:hypothetical protein n=1 Tax=Staphylococcus epidermidis TaxID=1282 RepID=UPI0011A5FDDD